ncbi:MAG: helix-turn-helix domain-containing protein [Terriglobia bacterium]
METELLRVSQAARYLTTSEWTMRQLAKTGKIPFVRTGGKTSPTKFLRTDLDSYIAAHRVPAKGAP